MQIQVDECDVERNSSDSNCMDTNSLIDEINESYNQSLQQSSEDSNDHVNIEMLEPVSTTLTPPVTMTSDEPIT